MEEQFDPTNYISNLDFENKQLKNKNNELASALTSNMEDDQNLIQYQLETDKILERIQHYLKGDQIKFNDQGAYFSDPTKNVLALVKKDPKTKITYFIQELKEQKKGSEIIKEVLVKIKNKDNQEINVLEQDSERILNKLKHIRLKNLGYSYVEVLDEDKKPFNEYGVAELMRIISTYVTKETMMSSYNEERINEILGDLGTELNKFLYCNYEKMGMDTKFKESKYLMICINILHVVESCYRRALGGEERESLRTRAIVTQSQGIGGAMMPRPMNIGKKKWHPLKPSSW